MAMTELDLIALILAGCLLLISGAFWERLFFAKRHFKLRRVYNDYLNIAALPTVSVCIPARNEGRAIGACLDRVLASDYPKMEVIVLDDDSVDNTSELAKGYAQQGVRFIKGEKLPRTWIGKNHALAQLTKQAAGDYIVFMGVDTLVGRQDISTMIKYMLDRNLAMLSVMPCRSRMTANVAFGTLRFFWELILHSRNFPAVSTSIWAVQAHKLEAYGDFWSNHRATVRPESILAGFFYAKHQYHFLVANEFLEITHEKDWSSQLMTSIRTSGPIFDKSIWLKANVLVVLIIIVVGSVVCFSQVLTSGLGLVRIISGASLLAISLMSMCYARISWQYGWLLGLINWPWAFVQEMWLLIISMIYHRFNIVSWKGRRLPQAKSEDDCC